MVVIRLSRGGTNKRPFYHFVVTNSRNARDGRYIERVGFYNPIAAGSEVKLQVNQERIDHWLSKGAQPSERVDFLLKNAASILTPTEKDIAVKAAKAKRKKAKAEKTATSAAEAAPTAAA